MNPFDELVDFFDAMAATRWYGPALLDFAVWAAGDHRGGRRALDVGCGPGRLLLHLAPRFHELVGLDLSAAMLERARAHARAAGQDHVRLVQGDAHRLPFADASFDLVTSALVVFLLDEPAAAVAEMARVTVPGGRVAVLVPSQLCSEETAAAYARRHGLKGFDAESVVRWGKVASRHHRYDAEGLAALLAGAGLTSCDVWYRLDGLALLARARRPGR